jgi:broad specificity phosphatase PhoE
MSHIFYLARHGETADNARRVFQGQAGSGLNKLGKAQAQRLAARMARRPPNVIFASDLERAAQTAGAVATACNLPITLDPALREVDVGLWTGKGYDEISQLYPEEWAAWEAGLDVRRGGGETYAELANRVDGAIANIAASQPDGTSILIVSHGGSIKSWVSKILNVGPEGLRALAGVANTGLTVVERDSKSRHRLHTWNDVSHLEGLVVDEHSD